ncbi:hypothetical protein BDN72DRAFT_221051 [Pluteus cervinus]|uniref:Uncharacterized protein n=1 Tax=Pluteus cervinus TaxID=181527 RepID=A0ACD3AH54_9AGAR|nr:hypothetical protein BDN72DRAFT_221051 [Pluteus cervinus]
MLQVMHVTMVLLVEAERPVRGSCWSMWGTGYHHHMRSCRFLSARLVLQESPASSDVLRARLTDFTFPFDCLGRQRKTRSGHFSTLALQMLQCP